MDLFIFATEIFIKKLPIMYNENIYLEYIFMCIRIELRICIILLWCVAYLVSFRFISRTVWLRALLKSQQKMFKLNCKSS